MQSVARGTLGSRTKERILAAGVGLGVLCFNRATIGCESR